MSDGLSRAGPDPSLLTTQQLLREIQHINELFTTRLEGMDKAVQLLQDLANRSPTVNEVFTKHEQKFETIALQFSERDVRMEQSAMQTKIAIDAALQAAEKAVVKQQEVSDRATAKSETSFTKQIDQLVVIIAAGNKASDDKIDDLKERLATLDGHRGGMKDGWGYLVGGIGIVITIVTLILSRGDKQERVYVPAPAASEPK